MTKTYNVLCLSEAMSPITHASSSAGNESMVAREPVVTENGIAYVPHLSGNSIRHRMIREPGMRWLVDQYELAGKLSLMQVNFLFHGGALTEGGGREDTGRIANMQNLWPLLRLLGGSLPDQILAGSLLVGRGTLVCRENAKAIASLVPEGWIIPDTLYPAEHFISGFQYTRGDGRKKLAGIFQKSDEEKPAESNLMIFNGQAVTRGSCFIHAFTLQHVSEIELGALLWSLRLWQASGGTVGGSSSRGHGKLSISVHCDADGAGAVEKYRAHIASVKVQAVEWLMTTFAPKTKKKSKKEEASA